MNTNIQTKSQSQSSSFFHLYVNADYHVTVDEKGYCASERYEGALGMILQIVSSTGGGGRLALKIPRLLADTARENSYIARLAEFERNIVNELTNLGATDHGLLAAERATIGVLEKEIYFGKLPGDLSPEEKRAKEAQQGGVILIQFSKGYPVRLLNARLNSKGEDDASSLPIQFYPPQSVTEEIKALSAALAKEWAKLTQGPITRNELNCPYVVRLAGSSVMPGVQSLDDNLGQDLAKHPWYVYVPSILFGWGSTSFQQDALDPQKCSHWTPEKQVIFCAKILEGVQFLHKKKKVKYKGKENEVRRIHSDIRPANILYSASGETEATREPQKYRLIDFGGAGPTDGGVPVNAADVDVTVPGPTVVPTRYSVFYSEERGLAEEKEIGNIALWRRVATEFKTTNLLLISWEKSEDAKLQKSLDAIERRLKAPLGGGTSEPPGRVRVQWPAKGDRVRIRDYVFVIESAQQDASGLILYCEGEYYKVLHNSLSIPVDHALEWPLHKEAIPPLSISRITQMMQLGPASDIYSLGVLLMYVQFWNGSHKVTQLSGGPDSTPSKVEPNKQANIRREGEFKDMIRAVAGDSWLKYIWWTLTPICKSLEEDFPKLIARAAELEIKCKDLTQPPDVEPSVFWHVDWDGLTKAEWERSMRRKPNPASDDRWKSIMIELKETCEAIFDLIPGSSLVYASAGKNAAIFLMLFHYVMRCLHRADAIPERTANLRNIESNYGAPFCSNRLSSDELNWGAADQASKALESILGRIRGNNYEKLTVQFDSEDDRPLPTTFELRRLLKEREDELEEREDQLKVSADRLKKILNSAKSVPLMGYLVSRELIDGIRNNGTPSSGNGDEEPKTKTELILPP